VVPTAARSDSCVPLPIMYDPRPRTIDGVNYMTKYDLFGQRHGNGPFTGVKQ